MRRITVLLGGNSPEREVSLVSGSAIAKGLRERSFEVNELDPADFPNLRDLLEKLAELGTEIVFFGLHGGVGENGVMQAALDLAGISYTGSGHKASALAMDKYISKLLAFEEGIPTSDSILMREDLLCDYNDPEDYQGIVERLGLPLVVKPNDGGSSVGISIVEDILDLKDAVRLALKYSSSALLERYVAGREITATVLDGKALPLVEIRPVKGWYDYQNKYNEGRSEYLAPAPLEENVSHLIQLYAERTWQILGLSGYARIDFRYDGQTPYFLEANTLPGMTPLSLTPMAAKSIGMSFADLVERIANIAAERKQ
ncbi:MAG: D-alanine--D-alanine ligase [Candidatus Syntrophosphaera sp.]